MVVLVVLLVLLSCLFKASMVFSSNFALNVFHNLIPVCCDDAVCTHIFCNKPFEAFAKQQVLYLIKLSTGEFNILIR